MRTRRILADAGLVSPAILVLDPGLANVWYIVSGGAAVTLVALLLANHVLELDLGAKTRRFLDLIALTPFLVFLVYVVARPLL